MTVISITSSRQINPLMSLVPRGDDFSLIPPLQLAQAHLGYAGNIAAAESASRCRRGFRTLFFVLNMIPRLRF